MIVNNVSAAVRQNPPPQKERSFTERLLINRLYETLKNFPGGWPDKLSPAQKKTIKDEAVKFLKGKGFPVMDPLPSRLKESQINDFVNGVNLLQFDGNLFKIDDKSPHWKTIRTKKETITGLHAEENEEREIEIDDYIDEIYEKLK